METVFDLFYVDCFEICFVEIVFDLFGEGYILSCVRPMESWFYDFVSLFLEIGFDLILYV